jgi:hypothetical protein
MIKLGVLVAVEILPSSFSEEKNQLKITKQPSKKNIYFAFIPIRLIKIFIPQNYFETDYPSGLNLNCHLIVVY